MKNGLGTIAALLLPIFCLAAQPRRIATAIDTDAIVALKGSVPAKALAQYDRGPVDPAMTLAYITILLQPSAAQQASLERLLRNQQDPDSPNYHKWLTPEQYADLFGMRQTDLTAITTWLRAQGFSIVQVARSRDWIAFSGTAALVESTFHTQIDYFDVDGRRHYSNAKEISIPQALDGILIGLRGLDDFSLKPMGVGNARRPDLFPFVQSFYNLGGAHFLSPDDVAAVYNLTPLYTSKIDGSGMKLVVAGQVDISASLGDIDAFRSAFGLTKNDPQQTIVPGSANPGTNSGDMLESKLDLEWAGAVARNATILFITAATSSGGVSTAAQYAIDNKLAPAISLSYGACESDNAAFLPGNEMLLQQANAEGITFITASGDTGPAACDSDDVGQVSVASHGLSVNYPASSPEATGVGGTEFSADVSNPGLYWSGSNSATGGSALSYIPEMSWNDTAARNQLSASGGGKSSCDDKGCAKGFAKPTWQTGAGVPNDGVRDVPDVSITASPDHDGYIICENNSCSDGIGMRPTIVGGTSASAPVFAGIVVLINQFVGGGGLGNINPTLYSLAANSGNGVFHDVTTGGNLVPCKTGTPDCPSTAPFIFGYTAGPGYDRVTGLGSVDGNNLVCQWLGKICSNTAITVVPSQVTPPGSTTPVSLSATVSSGQSSGTPTGTVTFFNGSTQLGNVAVSSGMAGFSYNIASLQAGVYPITAKYSGDSNFATSTSAAETLTVGTTTTTSMGVSPGSVSAGTSGPVTFNATVAPTSGTGTPTGTITFSDTSGQLGSPVTLDNGSATFSYNPSSLAGGTYSVTASYTGDAIFVPSHSAPQTLNVLDFSMAANPATITISAPGQAGSTTVSITDLGGFSQALSFTCSGLPSGANCSFSALSASSETMTISTTAGSVKLQPFRHNTGLFFAFLFPSFLGIAGIRVERRSISRFAWRMRRIVVLGVFIIGMSACGGGGGTSNPGTPTGTSTVTITAASSGANAISHKITVTLTVE